MKIFRNVEVVLRDLNQGKAGQSHVNAALYIKIKYFSKNPHSTKIINVVNKYEF